MENKPFENRKLIGITGGIGAGKSLVSKIFQTLGIPVFNADDTAKSLIETDPELKNDIIQLFGNEAYIENKYNRKYIANRVFYESSLLQKLNNLVHPKVREHANYWLSSQEKLPYYLYEAALMKAAGDGNLFNKVIVVFSPIYLRIERIKARDNRTEAEILAIINKQISDEERVKIADFQIFNDEKASIIKQVMELHKHWI